MIQAYWTPTLIFLASSTRVGRHRDGWPTFGYETLPLLFPLASGFALVGPVAAVGLYQMSRRREENIRITRMDAFGVIGSPAFGAILVLGFVLLAISLLWLLAANVIYELTLGLSRPVSITASPATCLLRGRAGR